MPNTRSRALTLDFRGGGDGGEGFNSVGWVICVLILVWRSVAALETHSLILVFYGKFQNDFRETSRGKTSHIVDVRFRPVTRFYDERPNVGIKGPEKW